MSRICFLATWSLVLLLAACQTATEADATGQPTQAEAQPFLPPAERWGPLFVDVQMAKVFPDGKTFVDCTPKQPAEAILEAYEAAKAEPGFRLKAFVLEHFELLRLLSEAQ